ncbi:MAG TPA: exodeoxyribonuclease III [Burkholderiaceae bacterium]|nr:exodeoxyribonuclease III [Burkholderiaceae bacterium]HQR75599.1 exodeoxyribonuclease III [Burkholderiaceae bacterium]
MSRTLTLATWNVNSLKVRLPHLLDWLATHRVDIVCLQETKLVDENFPVADLAEAGYAAAFAGQKTYNGVALLTRRETTPEAIDIVAALPGLDDPQKRLISATVGGIRVVCAYFPNGQSVGSEKYDYKLRWIAALNAWLRTELAQHPQVALAGDFNIAPEDRDVHDPKAWAGQVLFSEPEKQAFRDLIALGFVDSFRLFEQPERSYTWWDYRMQAFRRKMGLRIDHVLLSTALAPHCTACSIDVEPRRREQPSDHAPVIATLSI